MKTGILRMICGLLVLALVLSLVPAGLAEVPGGTCGKNLTWRLENGVLTISGTGEMDNYSIDEAVPWFHWRDEIVRAVVEPGVTTIGENAFDYCSSMTQVSIPGSVRTIGSCAFLGCEALEYLALPEGLEEIGPSAFYGCCNMTWVTFPQTLSRICFNAFADCAELLTVTFPASLTSLGVYAFIDCHQLSTVIFEGHAPELQMDCFFHVSATVYYPDNDPTWTPDLFQHYAGTLTWKSQGVAFRILEQPLDFVGKPGDTAVFSVTTDGKGLAFQWYYSANGGRTWNPSGMAGSRTSCLQVPMTAARVGQMYKCLLSDGRGNVLETQPVSMQEESPAATAPEIVTQPEDFTGEVGDTARFTVEAKGENLTYQWYYSASQGRGWSKSGLPGNQTPTLSVLLTAARVGQMYKCIITGADGEAVESRGVTLRAIPTNETVLAILTQPANYTGAVGSAAVFTVTAQGEGVTYQWYYSSNQGRSWNKSGLSGFNTPSLQVTMTAARVGQMYKCVLTDAQGSTLETQAVSLNQR